MGLLGKECHRPESSVTHLSIFEVNNDFMKSFLTQFKTDEVKADPPYEK